MESRAKQLDEVKAALAALQEELNEAKKKVNRAEERFEKAILEGKPEYNRNILKTLYEGAVANLTGLQREEVQLLENKNILIKGRLAEEDIEEIKKQLKYESSSASSDIEMSYEKHGRKEIQKQLYRVFKIVNFEIEISKEFDEANIYKLIGPYCGPRTDGEVYVYLGIISPSKWAVVDPNPSNFHIFQGSFQKCCESLENQKDKQRQVEYPTTKGFPDPFNYYAVFEVTHQSKPGYKLKQLEYQLQYIVAREFHRLNKVFPPNWVSGIGNEEERRKAYAKFVGTEVLLLVCFAGLITPFEFQEKENAIIDIIKNNSGIDKPCLFSIMENNRLMYLQSQTFSQRFESLERKVLKLDSLKMHMSSFENGIEIITRKTEETL